VASDKPGFFDELRRRHVVRVAIAYAVAGWLLVQVATQVFPFFRIPDWSVRLVVVLIVIGFPVAVAFAWIFELTPEGIRRTAPVGSPDARPELEHRSVGQKLNAFIVVVLVLAVALLGWRLYAVKHAKVTVPSVAAATGRPGGAQRYPGNTAKRSPGNNAPASATVATQSPGTAAGAAGSGLHSAQPIPAKSIAVLPFENLSNDKNNDYFVAGMQDLILTKLADIGDLKVISRTSTMQYGSDPGNLKTVGQQLGVATILEGSVQKAGNQVLINVQLINTKTDSHIWAQSYTRTLDNVFNVEGDVAGKIAAALNTKLSGAEAANLAAVPTTNQAAYDLFLRAEYAFNKSNNNYQAGDLTGFSAAIPLYRQAVEKDPGFTLAYARLSYVESRLAWLGGESVASLNRQARTDAEQARELAPHAAATLLALGYCDYYGKLDYAGALKAFQALLASYPNNSEALAAQGYIERRQGRFEAGIASLEKAFGLDPRNGALANEIATTYMGISRYPEAERWLRRALALDPDNLGAKYNYAYAILFGSGDVARALTAASGDAPVMQLTRVDLLTRQRKYREALALLDAIPDTPDNFTLVSGGSKVLQEADLYRWMGEPAKARPLYKQALAVLRPQLAKSEKEHNQYLAEVWTSVADADLGLGHTGQGLAAIEASRAAAEKTKMLGPYLRAYIMELNAGLYAKARRPDLAVPLLEKALAMPAIGVTYSPVMLWLDPAWDPIRHDPSFQALLKKYAKYKPAVIYPAALS
jgi:TolB-like protein